MANIALNTYDNHRRAEHAYEVEQLRNTLETYREIYRNEKRAGAVHKRDAKVAYSSMDGAKYGSLAGAAIGIILTLSQGMLSPAVNTLSIQGMIAGDVLPTVVISVLIGAVLGTAIGSIDSAFKSFEESSSNLKGAARLN